MQDDFNKEAAISHIASLLLFADCEKSFLRATRIPEWMTLDELVSCLDDSSYWTGDKWNSDTAPESRVSRRRHVREMIEWLWSVKDEEMPLTEQSPMLSKMVPQDDGRFERVFKQASLMSVGELRDLADDKGSGLAFNQHRVGELRRGEDEAEFGGSFDLASFYMDELSETAMDRAWPHLDTDNRRWVALFGVKLYIVERQMIEGLLDSWKDSPPKTEGEVHERVLSANEAAWDSIAKEFAEKQEVSIEEAEKFVKQDAFRLHSTEFSEAIRKFHDSEYGWTLDEQFMFVLEERELD